MKKFKFPLQKVLEIRQHLEKEKQHELAVILNRLAVEQQKMKSLSQQKEGYIQKRIETVQQGAHSWQILEIDRFIKYLKVSIENRKKIIEKINIEVSKKQDEIISIMKEKRMMEIYKDQKRTEYNKELQKWEQDFLDELAIRQFHQAIHIA